eukprot:5833964-Prymnesium_polylepis.2
MAPRNGVLFNHGPSSSNSSTIDCRACGWMPHASTRRPSTKASPSCRCTSQAANALSLSLAKHTPNDFGVQRTLSRPVAAGCYRSGHAQLRSLLERRCVMELFVFLFMQGTLDRVDVLPIDARTREEVEQRFLLFDARSANCFVPSDKERLLAVVES